jgi:hypothetical protein
MTSTANGRAWLFTRGRESVRLEAEAGTAVRLIIAGPGTARSTKDFRDLSALFSYQASYERRLVLQGFALERFIDERRGRKRHS